MANHKYSLPKSALLAALIFSVPLASAKKDQAPKDFFAEDPATQHAPPAQEFISVPPEDDEEVEPAISPVDAAQRAQSHIDGQVMNVRKFKDDSKTLYGVKLLQKNGRMKTVNVDANNGNIIE